MKKIKLNLLLTAFLVLIYGSAVYGQDEKEKDRLDSIAEDDPRSDFIADSMMNQRLHEASFFKQEVSEEKLNTIGYNYIGVLHTISSSMLYVDLNRNPKGLRATNLRDNSVLADIRILREDPCQKFLVKVPHNVDVKIEVLKPDGITWQFLKTVSSAYEKVDVLDFTRPYFNSVSSYYTYPEGRLSYDYHHQYRQENQNILFESLIFQQNINSVLYAPEDLDHVKLYASTGGKNLGDIFPNILPCENEIYTSLLSIENFFKKYWTMNSFIRLNCDSSRMLDSLNKLYFDYYYNFTKCKKVKIKHKGGFSGPNGETAPCNCQRMANHIFEHAFGENVDRNIFPYEFYFSHPTKNAHRWGSWDINRKDHSYGGSGEQYGLGGTVGGLQNYLVLRSNGNCSVRTSRNFEVGSTNDISNTDPTKIRPSYQYEMISLGYFCEDEEHSLPEKCECEIPVHVKYKADAKFHLDAGPRSCQSWFEGRSLSKAEGSNLMAFTVYDVYHEKFKKIQTATMQDYAAYHGGGFTLGDLIPGMKSIANGIATIMLDKDGKKLPDGLDKIFDGLDKITKKPPTITGGNQRFADNKHVAMFDDNYSFMLVQNEPIHIRLDNHLRLRIEGEDGFYNWAHYQSEFALAYKWNTQKTFLIPGDPETFCCHDGVGGFIKSFTDDNSVTRSIYNDAVKGFFFNVNFTPKFNTTPQEGKGFRQKNMNCINWVTTGNYGGQDVLIKGAGTHVNKDIFYFENNRLHWNISNELKGYNVKLYNSMGQEVMSTYSIPVQKKTILDYKNLPTGIYYGIIQSGDEVNTFKFAK